MCFKVIKTEMCFAPNSSDVASRILDDDFSDVASTSSTIRNESSEEISGQDSEFSDMEEETEHTVDPYQFEPVASNSDEDSYSIDSEEDSNERLLSKDW